MFAADRQGLSHSGGRQHGPAPVRNPASVGPALVKLAARTRMSRVAVIRTIVVPAVAALAAHLWSRPRVENSGADLDEGAVQPEVHRRCPSECGDALRGFQDRRAMGRVIRPWKRSGQRPGGWASSPIAGGSGSEGVPTAALDAPSFDPYRPTA
jgi:hypothetical protein